MSHAIHIMLADGEIHDSELQLLKKLRLRFGLKGDIEIQELLLEGSRPNAVDLSEESRLLCLAECIQLVTADGEIHPKEARAWTVRTGSTAPQAAGVIHTDFERGFIRAETISYDDYIASGGEAGAKDAGKLRVEGKEYITKDGDIFHFRFNV